MPKNSFITAKDTWVQSNAFKLNTYFLARGVGGRMLGAKKSKHMRIKIVNIAPHERFLVFTPYQ